MQPFNDSSELGILQSFYLNPELIYQCDIKTDDFSNIEYRQIYATMLKLYVDGTAFELKTFLDIAPDINFRILYSVFNEAVTAANINYHVAKVQQASFTQQAAGILQTLQTRLGDEDFLLEAEKALTTMQEIQSRRNADKTLSERLMSVYDTIIEAKRHGNYGVPTGWPKLDEAIVGLCPKHLILLGGYTSPGKSTILSQLLHNICEYGSRVLVFSVEDSIEEKLKRLAATITQISMKAFTRGWGHAEEKFKQASEEIMQYKLSIYDNIYTLEEIEMKIKKHMLMGGVDVVAIDFVQNIITSSDKIYDRMSEIAIKLQRIAKQYNICVFALSQVSSDEKGKIALRGAQELASAADIVLWIDREQDMRNFNLIVRKNRPFGQTGKIAFTFDDTWTSIREA